MNNIIDQPSDEKIGAMLARTLPGLNEALTTSAETATAETKPEKEPCPECDGTGRDAEADAACVFCKGSGKKTFRIDSQSAAEWLLKKLSAIEAEQELIKAQTAKRVKELTADYNRLMGRYGAELRAWGREEATRRGRQSATIMYGTLAFRAQTPQLIIKSLPDAITTAKAMLPEAVTVETVETLDQDAFLRLANEKFIQNAGELLPGIDRTEAGESFSILFGKEKPEAKK